jgi:hypothetical protein
MGAKYKFQIPIHKRQNRQAALKGDAIIGNA